jgi:protein-L-isoaspartate(D-aspartate) O-methyltransferase
VTQPDYSVMRNAMVDSQLRTIGVTDPALVEAIAFVPREEFVPEAAKSTAYVDAPVRIGEGRYLNPPSATGMLLSQAGLTEQSSVLVVGSASGYCAAIVARMAKSVTALEEDPGLVSQAKSNLADASNILIVEGALENGAPDAGPFDVILIDGAIENVPDTLFEQLAEGGVLVCGQKAGNIVHLCRGSKIAGFLKMTAFAEMDCVSLPGFTKEKIFSF